MPTFLFILLLAFASDNWAGTWNLDLKKSEYNPGPSPRSIVLQYEAIDGGVKVTNDTVDNSGKSTVRTVTLKFDGKDYPYANNVNADAASGTRVDDSTFETVWKKEGKPTLRQRISVSADRKTLTVLQTGTDYQGKTVRNLSVYTRVK